MRRTSHHRQRVLSIATVVVTGLSVLVTSPGAAAPPPADSRQDQYAAAAAEFGVPESVLLGVSYLQSRWDTNSGSPSTSAGFGPMHLTDAARAPTVDRDAAHRARHHQSRLHEQPAGLHRL